MTEITTLHLCSKTVQQRKHVHTLDPTLSTEWRVECLCGWSSGWYSLLHPAIDAFALHVHQRLSDTPIKYSSLTAR